MYFLYDLLHISAAKHKYLSVKQDPELAEACVSYGLMGIVNAVLSVAGAFGFQWGLSFLLTASAGNYILGWILVVVFAIVILTQLISAAINSLWQLRLNRKVVGYFSFLCLLGAVAGVVLVITLFKI